MVIADFLELWWVFPTSIVFAGIGLPVSGLQPRAAEVRP